MSYFDMCARKGKAVRKTLIIIMLALCLSAGCVAVAADSDGFFLRFDEGFILSLPRGWVSYPAGEGDLRYILGDGAGGRYLYILACPAQGETFEELLTDLEGREDCERISVLKLNGQDFAAFIAPGLNASGCATLLGGERLTFLFTPQDDSDYMLTVSQIMDSFRVA